MEITIRLLDANDRGALPAYANDIVMHLTETVGLFPYLKDWAPAPALRKLVINSHRVIRDKPFTFHSEQMEIFLSLLDGNNVVLSAPTSFGKSAILDYFIIERRPRTVVIIVPTIALIDETRRRLIRNVGFQYQILFHKDDVRDNEHAIYVMTQERVLDRTDIKKVDFLFIDEFYKLHPDRDDPRYQFLNIALYRLSKISRQVFMAGPHISGINFGREWTGKFTFIQTNFRTVAVDIIDRTREENRLSAFLQDYAENKSQLSIAFAASPGSARELSKEIIDADDTPGSGAAIELAEWLSANYSPHWGLVECLKHGIGLHHGRLPRAIAQRVIDLFERSELKVLICTSTLIEGVNTSAAIIYVYDKKINTTDFDFFSFANIRGRAGRMMRHFVGKVFLYHDPPDEVQTVVDVPIYSDPDHASEPILFGVSEADIEDEGIERREEIKERSQLSAAIIERYGSLGLQNLINLREAISATLEESPLLLLWSGLPSKEQRNCLFNLVFEHVIRPNRLKVGARSGSQLSFFVEQLRRSKSLRSFLSFLVQRAFREETEERRVDMGFEFLRGCDYTIPTAVMACEAIVNLLVSESVNWSFFATGIENYFRPSWVKALDERGIPMPLAEKLQGAIPTDATIGQVLRTMVEIRDGQRSLDLQNVEQALISNFA
ncbi:DEAD/DEAH box helicase (plasmid) [Rhizobium leguminosarum]|uniref:DEAD/DEAH box helicase n=1 Tax=Rhizobium leguminosarum TaxID=384 RepID=UPI00102FD4DE|nr:DEAD/DEAH box helicase [Rhizobium leguminosarum]TAX87144.1 DEAD/DEAH box helicase [Rhizobium leguminosarum]